jgi:hypothetical protein
VQRKGARPPSTQIRSGCKPREWRSTTVGQVGSPAGKEKPSLGYCLYCFCFFSTHLVADHFVRPSSPSREREELVVLDEGVRAAAASLGSRPRDATRRLKQRSVLHHLQVHAGATVRCAGLQGARR